MSEDQKFYGHLKSGEAVYEYTLTSPTGVVVKALNYGGIMTEFSTRLTNGSRQNVILTLDSLEAYEENPNYVGVLVGRYGGRLSTPLNLGTSKVSLSANDRGNCLHGGFEGFGKKLFSAQVVKEATAETLHLKYMSRDQEEGFPGNLMVHISYRLWEDGQLQIIYRGVCDQDTAVALTHHNYFNLSPDGGNVLDHHLRIEASALQKTGENQTPGFERVSLENHPVTEGGITVAQMNQWILETLGDDKGLDYPFDQKQGAVHKLWHEPSGLSLMVTSDCPSVVVYSGGWLDESLPTVDKRGAMPFGGICFETQEEPNGPNHLEAPGGILSKGELYHRTTTFKLTL